MSDTRKYAGKDYPWQQTLSGKEIVFKEVLEGDLSQICINDVAHSLAGQGRYAGHTKFHLSIAQHSTLASHVMEELTGDPMEGLMHDCHEAYTTDLPTPIKSILGPTWYQFEHSMQARVYQALAPSLTMPMSSLMKDVDYALLSWESSGFVIDRINDWGIPIDIQKMEVLVAKVAKVHNLDRPICRDEAKEIFLKRYEELK